MRYPTERMTYIHAAYVGERWAVLSRVYAQGNDRALRVLAAEAGLDPEETVSLTHEYFQARARAKRAKRGKCDVLFPLPPGDQLGEAAQEGRLAAGGGRIAERTGYRRRGGGQRNEADAQGWAVRRGQ